MMLLRVAPVLAVSYFAFGFGMALTQNLTDATLSVEEGSIKVSVENGFVTGSTGHATLADVLKVVGQHAGIHVIVRGDLGRTSPLTLEDVPLEEAIRSLLRNAKANLIMLYEGKGVGRRLYEVRAYGGVERVLEPPIPLTDSESTLPESVAMAAALPRRPPPPSPVSTFRELKYNRARK